MPPAASLRRFVQGAHRNYECRTVTEVDRHLAAVRAELGKTLEPRRRASLLGDVDLLLDRRAVLAK